MAIDPQWKKVAVELARQAGVLMHRGFHLGQEKKYKSDDSSITETDLAINALVLEKLKSEFPAFGVIAEEGSDFHDEEFSWVCDPLDGTNPFSRGIPTFAFSLALVHDGNPILAVVLDPILDRLYVAEKDRGATMNENLIHVSKRKWNEKSWIFIGYMDQGNTLPDFRDHRIMNTINSKLHEEKVGTAQFLSAVYQGSLVAAGEFDGLIIPARKPWDLATIKLLIEEAGGKVTDLFGNEQRYDQETKGAVCSNGLIHEELLRIVASSL